MQRNLSKARSALVLTLTALVAGVCWIGSAQTAAAFFRPMGGHFNVGRMPSRSFSGRHYTFREHGSVRGPHSRRYSGLPGRSREGHDGRGRRYFPHRWVYGHHERWVFRHHPIGPVAVIPPGTSPGGNGRPNGNGRINGVPPTGERRFVPDEVLIEFLPRVSTQTIARFARTFNLTRLSSQSFSLLGGATFYRWRIAGGASVPSMVATLQNQVIVANAQPNYIYTLQDSATRAKPAGDQAQYALRTLQIEEAHQIATGKNVTVAVIDSEVDAAHPDLKGAVKKSFDALDAAGKPQAHGTAMAGAIAEHGKLLGVAPDAALLAARAFDDTPGLAKGTSFAIYKSLQWAADNNARVVNMSFVGPFDPALHRMLTAASEKSIVLIAAGGNGGPNSGPQYPAAEADVIAVAATDGHDGLFRLDNRNSYISVAAPGVDVLSLAPDGAYQISTGSSIAAAHVSGVVALLLQCQPTLKPSDVRAILTSTAKPVTAGQTEGFAPHLVNAYLAVKSAETVTAGDGPQQAKR